jgi:hypothetical protein
MGYSHDINPLRHPTPSLAQDPHLCAAVAVVEDRAARSGRGLHFHRHHDSDCEGRFAFPSLKALSRWFWKEDREVLEARGYVVRVYRVPADAVARSERQAVFLPAAARCVGTRALVSLKEAAS